MQRYLLLLSMFDADKTRLKLELEQWLQLI